MSCSSIDLKAYLFGELGDDDRRAVESHAATCEACREELARLRLTRETLSVLRDEEVPQRIGFVSDKVFEPSWWQSLWSSAPKLGFLSASLLSAAILVHAFARPVPMTMQPGAKDTAVIEASVERQVSRRLDAAVQLAVAQSEAREEKETAQLLAASDERHEMDLRALRTAFDDSYSILRKQVVRMYMASNGLDQPGGTK